MDEMANRTDGRCKDRKSTRGEACPTTELVRRNDNGSSAGELGSNKELPKIDFAAILGPDVATRLQATLGTADLYFTMMLLAQANQAAGCFESMEPKSLLSHFPAAALSSMGTRDGLEALLSGQMGSVHSLAMRFLARAASKGQTEAGLELYDAA